MPHWPQWSPSPSGDKRHDHPLFGNAFDVEKVFEEFYQWFQETFQGKVFSKPEMEALYKVFLEAKYYRNETENLLLLLRQLEEKADVGSLLVEGSADLRETAERQGQTITLQNQLIENLKLQIQTLLREKVSRDFQRPLN